MVAPRRLFLAALCALACALGFAVPSASAAKSCTEPGSGDWQAVDPAEAGMDGAKLRGAIAFGQQQNSSFAIRVYRNGCRVGEDGLAAANRNVQFQSWSLSKSVVALLFGRAMTLNAISPDDPLGSLIPEADGPHGKILMRDLLTMTNGLEWNGARDYNVFMPNRLQNALTTPVAKPPGTYWEYSQDGPALLAEAIQRAVGQDFQTFAQNQLFGPIGIEPGDWSWQRDSHGHTQGFFGLYMSADTFARLGELMRLRGVWQGRRLLSERFVSEALTPVATNGCYGYLIWLNASKPCVGPRVVDRPVDNERDFETLPTDVFQYAGLFGQWVTVFPSQGIVVVRTGQDNGTFTGAFGWQEEMYRRILGSITDDPVTSPGPAPDAEEVSKDDVDRGFFEAGQNPDQYSQGNDPPPLPPAGPGRARATLIEPRAANLTRRGRAQVRFRCPPAWPNEIEESCKGTASLSGARKKLDYAIPAGTKRVLRFDLSKGLVKRIKRKGEVKVTAKTRNGDEAGGTPAKRAFVITAR
ncbi:MAG: serine hydrolase domain-containing protein [Solirubrobacterales bacterium]